jgi:hypothetical protein
MFWRLLWQIERGKNAALSANFLPLIKSPGSSKSSGAWTVPARANSVRPTPALVGIDLRHRFNNYFCNLGWPSQHNDVA